MKNFIRSVALACVFTVSASSVNAATNYTDTVGDPFTGAGGGILDITSVEVQNNATDLIFKINLNGNPVTTDWGKYMIGFDTVAGGDTATTGNGWTRPISMANGMDVWVGTWADSGNGAELYGFGGSWFLFSATYSLNPDNLVFSKNANSVTVSFNFQTGLGLNIGDSFEFDVYTSGGGGGDSAIDALANPAQTVSDWGNAYTSILTRAYTLVASAPPEITVTGPTNGSIFVTNGTPVAFTVTSAFSSISTNDIFLFLNGVSVPALNHTDNSGGLSNNWSVSATPALSPNIEYTGEIIAEDADGNRATNIFTFNTFGPNNHFVEAEDYNFSSGGFIPDPLQNEYAGLAGSNGVDYLEFTDGGTNAYRPSDSADVEPTGDITRSILGDIGNTDYNLSFIQFGEWQNYTRRFSNVVHRVYARVASLSGDPTMLLERHASATAASSNQAVAALGTFVPPANTGGGQSYVFEPLKDFFSSNVLVRLSGTNTLRATRIGGGYNLNYLLFVPDTNTATLRPYIASGFPFPGAGNVAPDQNISFTIANRDTSVVPGSIQLFVNSSNVTSASTLSNNAAGSVVGYQTPAFFAPGSTNTVRAVYSDGSVTQTNDWQFTVATLLVIPPGFANPIGSGVSNGFNITITKAPNEAPPSQFPPSSTRAENHLAGLIINTNTGLPWTNEAAGPMGDGKFAEMNVINYEQSGTNSPDGDTFTANSLFPYVAATVPGSYTNDPNFISMEAITYLELTAGIHRFAVRSDDGFRLTVGDTNPTNLLVAEFEGGRGSGTPSVFDFIVETNGVYCMRLLHYEGEFGASIEWYSINRTTGEAILINDSANANSVKAFRAIGVPGVVLMNPSKAGNSMSFSFLTQAGVSHAAQFRTDAASGAWQTFTTVLGTGGTTNVTDNTATNATRVYRVETTP